MVLGVLVFGSLIAICYAILHMTGVLGRARRPPPETLHHH